MASVLCFVCFGMVSLVLIGSIASVRWARVTPYACFK